MHLHLFRPFPQPMHSPPPFHRQSIRPPPPPTSSYYAPLSLCIHENFATYAALQLCHYVLFTHSIQEYNVSGELDFRNAITVTQACLAFALVDYVTVVYGQSLVSDFALITPKKAGNEARSIILVWSNFGLQVA